MSTNVGKVKSLFRFPVKSMAGEVLNEILLDQKGFHCDRTWAIYHHGKKEIQGAKKIPALMQYSARYTTPQTNPNGDTSPEVIITTPSGEDISSSDPSCSDLLSEQLNENISLCNLKPASDTQHYRLSRRMNDKQLW